MCLLPLLCVGKKNTLNKRWLPVSTFGIFVFQHKRFPVTLLNLANLFFALYPFVIHFLFSFLLFSREERKKTPIQHPRCDVIVPVYVSRIDYSVRKKQENLSDPLPFFLSFLEPFLCFSSSA